MCSECVCPIYLKPPTPQPFVTSFIVNFLEDQIYHGEVLLSSHLYIFEHESDELA
jgi:hypothetical protein